MTQSISNVVGYGTGLNHSEWARLATISRLPCGAESFQELEQQRKIEEIKAENINPKPVESVLPLQDKTFGLLAKEFMPEAKQSAKKLEKQYTDAILDAEKGKLLYKRG